MRAKGSSFDWEALAKEWRTSHGQELWRCYSDSLTASLVRRWLTTTDSAVALKTDLFDEAFGPGIYQVLAERVGTVVGLDISHTVAVAARTSYPALQVVGGDLRCLPFGDAVFDVIVSNSSVDHFASHAELDQCLQELSRVLRPGGQLLLTLDNPTNPIIALRNRLPFPWLKRLGLVPYYVGATYSTRTLAGKLSRMGMEVVRTSAILHFPRVLAVPLSRAGRLGVGVERALTSLFGWFEYLERLPTRALTGHFIAVHAIRAKPHD